MPREGHDRNQVDNRDTYRKISIHVPREGHDLPRRRRDNYKTFHFNPRAPRGARLTPTVIVDFTALISIHVPREGHDYIQQLRMLTM